MYYVWESRRRDSREALISKFAPTLRLYGVSLARGRRLPIDLPELEIELDEDSQGTLTDDLIIKKRRCLVHSHRLIKVLQDTGVNNIDYYPCTLVNEVTGQKIRRFKDPVTERSQYYYQAANILDMVYCLDRENSDLEIDDEEPSEIWYIHNLKLLEDRLGDVLMCRLGERPSIVLVHQTVKEAIEIAGLTGVLFIPAEGYRDYEGYAFDNPKNVIGTHDLDPQGPADRMPEPENE